jgi:hypothetical protein
MIIKVLGKTIVKNSIMIRTESLKLQQRSRIEYLDRLNCQRTESDFKNNKINQ